MDTELEKYKESMKEKPLSDYIEISHLIDKEAFPERYAFIRQRIQELNTEPNRIEALKKLPKYASRTQRIEARIKDGLIFAPFMILIIIFFHKIPQTALVSYYLIYIASAVYFVIFHVKKGASLGKKSSNMKVVDSNGNQISWKSGIIRDFQHFGYLVLSLIGLFIALGKIDIATLSDLNLIKALNGVEAYYPGLIKLLVLPFTLWGVADLFSIFFSKKNRTLHDIIAGTYVVNVIPEN